LRIKIVFLFAFTIAVGIVSGLILMGTFTESRCSQSREAALKGLASGRNAKDDRLAVNGLDFEMTSKPNESPSSLGALTA
jgi:hypothetical protein